MLTRVSNEQQFLEANDSPFGGLANKHRERTSQKYDGKMLYLLILVYIFIYLNKILSPSYIDAKKSELGMGI